MRSLYKSWQWDNKQQMPNITNRYPVKRERNNFDIYGKTCKRPITIS